MYRLFHIAAVLMFLCALTACQIKQASQKPNFVIILADDLGYTDIVRFSENLTGDTKHFYETPHIDQLGADGLSFKQAYVNQLCSPTRAALLSGIHSAKLGFTTATPGKTKSFYAAGITPPPEYHPLDVIEHKDNIRIQQALTNGLSITGLPAGTSMDNGKNIITFAEALEDYRSGFVGKWHVGGHGALGYQPSDQGFAEIAYFDAGGSPYFNWRQAWDRKKLLSPEMPQAKLHIGNSGTDTGKNYLTDAISSQAISFIDQNANKDQPFLLYVAHFAVHTPIQAKKEFIDYFAKKSELGHSGKGNAVYAAMVKSLDDSVGAIRESLKKNGVDNNTYIIFLSDNGGVDYLVGKGYTGRKPTTFEQDGRWAPTSNKPLKGGKATVFEGGVRVPMIIQGPGIKPGQWQQRAVDVTDIFPTLLDLADVPLPTNIIDGQSLIPLLGIETDKTYTKDTIYWHYPFNVIVQNPDNGLPLSPHSAIRKREFKLVVDWHGEQKLYNIEQDPFETINLASTHPKLVRALQAELVDWINNNVAERYRAYPNPDYDPELDTRPPFTQLSPTYLN